MAYLMRVYFVPMHSDENLHKHVINQVKD